MTSTDRVFSHLTFARAVFVALVLVDPCAALGVLLIDLGAELARHEILAQPRPLPRLPQRRRYDRHRP